ncbi:hypothetical protein [Clostridium estertheticum]|uniref:hypothetical protein n=1 Tax=Clostridium estertheticum TaxID=238834 RepID=UPI0028153B13|nr:hypothetical protein [Clostridium estertheticum]
MKVKRFSIFSTLNSSMFFKGKAVLVAYSMYLIGLIVAILVAGIIHIIDKNNSINDLLIELPEYKAPSIQTVLLYVWDKVKGYLSKAGTIIFLSSIIIWFLFN